MEQYSGKNAPEEKIPRVKGHQWDWLEAIRTGRQAGSNFGYGGPLTQVQDFIDQPGILMVATDPVAMDTIELGAIEKTRRQRGAPSVWQQDSKSITADSEEFHHDASKNLFFGSTSKEAPES